MGFYQKMEQVKMVKLHHYFTTVPNAKKITPLKPVTKKIEYRKLEGGCLLIVPRTFKHTD